VGKNLPTSRDDLVHVRLAESDDADEVVLEQSVTPVAQAEASRPA
jgi:pyrimidine operon attenuation protein/uracil phosphoribosyltransferase